MLMLWSYFQDGVNSIITRSQLIDHLVVIKDILTFNNCQLGMSRE